MAIETLVDRRVSKYLRTGKGFKLDRILQASPHIVDWHDDFLGDQLDAKYTPTSAGTSGALAIVAGTLNGIVRFDAGTDDNGTAYLTTGLAYKGDRNCTISARLKMDDITDNKFEFGFTDALADANGAVNTLSTPTAHATDAAVWVLDSDDLSNGKLQAFGVRGGVVGFGASGVETGLTIEPTTITFVNGEYLTLTVACRGDQVRFLAEMDEGDVATDGTDEPFYDSGWQENGIEGGTLVTPWIFSQTKNAGSGMFLDMDYLTLWQSRV